MHALMYYFRTKDDKDLLFDYEAFNEETCLEGRENCKYPLFDWLQLGGRFRGTIPLKKEHLDKLEKYTGTPGIFNNEPRLPNGVDYAKYEWIDMENWQKSAPVIMRDNEILHHFFDYDDDEMSRKRAKEVAEKIVSDGFYDVTAFDIHF